ncbi:MAG: twin-arginine translocase subunit TatC [Rickettsiales bacterium]|nr:twin-arginine translocase subunit TatC [Rickettsiales bacterium]|tara:strand:+ start:379 stop:1191 length:813 start_codon:yes stop_codon:yes gene_type:complete
MQTQVGEPSPDVSAEDEVDAYRMTLLEHLLELRRRVIFAGLALVIAVCVMLPLGGEIFEWLKAPAEPYFPEGGGFTTRKVAEKFLTYLKCSLFAGAFLASPVVFFQAWRFVAPGLYRRERSLALPFVVSSTLCFVGGAAFCYYLLLPIAMQFFMSVGAGDGIASQIEIAEYLAFVTRLMLVFGAVFELPLLIFFLARLGVVSASGLRSFRKYAIVLIFALAAFVTPPDPITQMMLAVPLVVLYELGVLTAHLWGRPPLGDDDTLWQGPAA